jgi:hypothetical protein
VLFIQFTECLFSFLKSRQINVHAIHRELMGNRLSYPSFVIRRSTNNGFRIVNPDVVKCLHLKNLLESGCSKLIEQSAISRQITQPLDLIAQSSVKCWLGVSKLDERVGNFKYVSCSITLQSSQFQLPA